ncbi:hypothetical protein QAD02_000335 [Eretmocerus hayati]|uniref:Uncharacterized protein n=1 Tax=Eretmocerus hayati TaxID=131215 RepID=A0ACC2NDV2_9HYME|nr:hypothetical protein QAD02_000335 [Eretmocerus hayati]
MKRHILPSILQSGDLSSYSDDSTSDENTSDAMNKSKSSIKSKTKSGRVMHSSCNIASLTFPTQKPRNQKKSLHILIRSLKDSSISKRNKSRDNSSVLPSKSDSRKMIAIESTATPTSHNRSVVKCKKLVKTSRSPTIGKIKKISKSARWKSSDSNLTSGNQNACAKKIIKNLKSEKVKSRAISQSRMKLGGVNDDNLEKKTFKMNILRDQKRKATAIKIKK